jgi:hypothetical protein
VKSSFVATRIFFVPFISLLFFAIVIWNLPALAVAQSVVPDDVKHDTPGQAIKQGQSVHIDVDLALVNVTVTDTYDRLVTGLEPDNFRIFENSVEQEIQYFSSEDVPISIGVIFDLSGSMANKVGKAREAALQFFKTANPQDEFSCSAKERMAARQGHLKMPHPFGFLFLGGSRVGEEPTLSTLGPSGLRERPGVSWLPSPRGPPCSCPPPHPH